MDRQSIRTTFIKYVSLNILGMLGLSCYILADTYFVARGIGAKGLAALNLAIPVYSFINGLGLMAGMGGATAYAIAGGGGDEEKRQKIFTQAAGLELAVSLVFFCAGLLVPDRLAILLGADEQVRAMTGSYLRVILLFAPMFMTNSLVICFVRNDGNPNLSMAAMILGSFSNIVLDYVFIIPLQMGMLGAAVATGIAPVVSLLVLSLHFCGKKNGFGLKKGGPSPALMGECAALGASSLIVEVSAGVVMIVFNRLVSGAAGNIGIAAYGILANIALVITSLFTGIGQGIQPLLSRFFGEGEERAVRRIYRYAAVLAALLALGIYGICAVFAVPVVSAFNRQGEAGLEAIAVRGLRIYFSAFVFAGINIVTAAYFSAVSKPGKSFGVSVLRGFLVILPAAVFLASRLGIDGIWLSMPLSEAAVSVVVVFLLRRGRNPDS